MISDFNTLLATGPVLSSSETNALLALERMGGHVFYLTGSRHFGHFRRSSDIDLFTQDSEGVREFLIGVGFRPNTESEVVAGSYNGDPNIAEVYQFGSETYFGNFRGIQVQLVKDVLLKGDIQLAIVDMMLPREMHESRHQMKSIWAALYSLKKVV